MATKTWRGDAVASSGLWTFVLGGTLEVGDILNITIGAKTYSYTLATTTIATEAAALVVLLQALSTTTYPEFAGLTWAYVSAGTFTATGTAGVKFTISVTTTEAGGGAADLQTFAVTNTTAPSGPNFASATANWGGSLPANGDTIIFENSDVDVLYDLDALAAVAPAAVLVLPTFTGDIGLARVSGTGSTSYVQYLPRYFELDGATSVQIGSPVSTAGFGGGGVGSGRVQFDFNASAASVAVYSSGTSSETGVAPVQLLGSLLTLYVTGGKVGVAMYAGETATLSAFRQAGENSEVEFGSGVSIGAITLLKLAGKLTTNSNLGGTLQHRGGETIVAAGTVATLDASEGGEVRYRGIGTLTAGTVGAGCHLDYSQDIRARTVTNLTVRKGATLSDPAKSVTFTNPVVFQCQPFKDCTIDWGPSVSLQRS